MLFLFIVIALIIYAFVVYWPETPDEDALARMAGEQGEELATRRINRALNEDDVLLTNIEIEYDGKKTELDNVIINKNGIFIIEVKNYSGQLYGEEDDKEWIKQHESDGGNIYEKSVRNPIRQVKREVYLLAKLLRYYGFKVWIEGGAYLVEQNSPVDSDYIFDSIDEIEELIHTPSNQFLSSETIAQIVNILNG